MTMLRRVARGLTFLLRVDMTLGLLITAALLVFMALR